MTFNPHRPTFQYCLCVTWVDMHWRALFHAHSGASPGKNKDKKKKRKRKLEERDEAEEEEQEEQVEQVYYTYMQAKEIVVSLPLTPTLTLSLQRFTNTSLQQQSDFKVQFFWAL